MANPSLSDNYIDPIAYGQKYKMSSVKLAHEHAYSSTDMIAKIKNKKRKPSAQAVRVSQLLDFIRENGLTPPEPFYLE